MSLTRSQREARQYFIYFLRCPDAGVARYVGMSSNPKGRLQNHRGATGANYKIREWVLNLREQGKQIKMDVVLGPLPYQVAMDVERGLIFKHANAYPDQNFNTPVGCWPISTHELEVRKLKARIFELEAEIESLGDIARAFTSYQVVSSASYNATPSEASSLQEVN